MNTLRLTTDQNVSIDVELASVGQRIVAVLLDTLIIVAYLIIMTFLISVIAISSFRMDDLSSLEFWEMLFVFIVYLPFLLYTPLMEYFTKGQTIGKKAMGIRVARINGENASFKEYFTRWLFRPLEFYILNIFSFGILLIVASAFFDILIASVSGKNQRIGDFMANTVVIRKNPHKAYSIRDVLSIKTNENYEPQYPNIIRYTDEDMMLVKKTISRVEKYKNTETKKLAIDLAIKIAEDLQIPEPEKKLQFLKTVLNDYIVLTR
ncbi:MAG: RDD family protein [Brumimicrobium sp.]|nr:RDD family protein [Brumimicrobium sp.]